MISRRAIQLSTWLCLLALTLHQLARPVLPELSAGQAAAGLTAYCHTGGADHHSNAPAKDPADCDKCPLCRLLSATGYVPPLRTNLGVIDRVPLLVLRQIRPADSQLGAAAVAVTPLQPRAPPVVV